jgi:UDP-N-acetyl-2-amino-2-deoxyglucuronate dehydrogenase
MKKYRVGVVGLGMVAKPHLMSLADLSNRVDIAACYTPSTERQAAFRAAYPRLPLATRLDGVLADKSIDAVILLTPPHSHLDLILHCARAGKHVLVEKPLDVSVERGLEGIEAMERAGLTLAVVLQHRFRSASKRLRARLADGELGKLVSGSASIRWWRSPAYYAQPGRGMKARDGGGVLITQAIHTLDLFQHLAGPIIRVAALAATSPLRRIDTEDIAGAAISFEDGAIGTIDATTVAYPGFAERIELACERGTAVLSAESLDLYFQDGRHIHEEGASSKSGGADPMAFSHEAHRGVIVDFLDALDEGRAPAVSGREAIKVQALIEAILRSAQEGRTVEIGP